MFTYYIGVGSNMGNRQLYMDTALNALNMHSGIYHIRTSPVIETQPWGNIRQGAFLNSVWACESGLSPHELLDVLQTLERQAHRKRVVRWGPRTLDLDILYGMDSSGKQIEVHRDDLDIPHPYAWDRLFVLEPLAVLEPDFTYNGESVRERIAVLRDER